MADTEKTNENNTESVPVFNELTRVQSDENAGQLFGQWGAVISRAESVFNGIKTDLENDESFKHLSWETANMINQVTGSKMKLRRSKGEVNVCKAIEGLMEDSKLEGIEEGIGIGRAELINSIKSLMAHESLKPCSSCLQPNLHVDDRTTLAPVRSIISLRILILLWY